MSRETIPLVASPRYNQFYTGQEKNVGEIGTTGASRKISHFLIVISILTAFACSIYGSLEAKSIFLMLPFIVVIPWSIIHILLIVFSKGERHEFRPPGWFFFVSSAHIFIQSLIVVILSLFKN